MKMTTASLTSSSTSRSTISGRVFECVFHRKRFAWKQRSFMRMSVTVEEILEKSLSLFGEDRLGMKLHPFHGEAPVPHANDAVIRGATTDHQIGSTPCRNDHQSSEAQGVKRA